MSNVCQTIRLCQTLTKFNDSQWEFSDSRFSGQEFQGSRLTAALSCLVSPLTLRFASYWGNKCTKSSALESPMGREIWAHLRKSLRLEQGSRFDFLCELPSRVSRMDEFVTFQAIELSLKSAKVEPLYSV